MNGATTNLPQMVLTNSLAGFSPPDPTQAFNNHFIQQVRQLVEILVGTGRIAEAEKIQTEAMALLDEPKLRSAVSDASQKVRMLEESSLTEPAYEGRKLLDWLSDIDYGQPVEKRARAKEAIEQMGTSAIPFLLVDLGDGNPQARYERQDARSTDERARQATWAFDALGAAGQPAIPQLENLLAVTPGYVPSALAGIGRDALPTLLKALTNEVFWVRDNTAAAIANGIHQGKFTGHEAIAALPIALNGLSYTNATNSLSTLR